MSTDTDQVVLCKKWVHKYTQDNDLQIPTDWIWEFNYVSFYAFAANQVTAEENNPHVHHSFGSFNLSPDGFQGFPPQKK